MTEPLIKQINQSSIRQLILNRPKKNNALNAELIEVLTHHLIQTEKDKSIKVLVLSGAGKHFCAGIDLHWIQTGQMPASVLDSPGKKLSDLLQRLYYFPKPIIGYVHGHIMGGGIGLLACCDFRIAAQGSVFCFPEIKLGLVPAIISPYLRNMIPQAFMQHYFLTAESFDYQTAQAIGLIHEINIATGATSFANKLTQYEQRTLQITQYLLKKTLYPIEEALIQQTIHLFETMRSSSHTQKRITDFLKKKSTSAYD